MADLIFSLSFLGVTSGFVDVDDVDELALVVGVVALVVGALGVGIAVAGGVDGSVIEDEAGDVALLVVSGVEERDADADADADAGEECVTVTDAGDGT